MRLARPRIRGMSSTRSWSSPGVSHMRGSGARVGDPLACSHAGEAPEVGEEMVRSIRKRHETFREPTAEGGHFQYGRAVAGSREALIVRANSPPMRLSGWREEVFASGPSPLHIGLSADC